MHRRGNFPIRRHASSRSNKGVTNKQATNGIAAVKIRSKMNQFYCGAALLSILLFVSVMRMASWNQVLPEHASVRGVTNDAVTTAVAHVEEGRGNAKYNRIVVTMTTMSSRIDNIRPTIDSLLNQTVTLDRFYLSLPKKGWTKNQKAQDGPQTLPSFLQKYEESGLITILTPEFDYGPVDKMIHALEKEAGHPDCHMIYLDDDVIYEKDLVQNLLIKSNEYPNATVAFSGAKLRSNFRQIAHRSLDDDRHPNLFFLLSGTKTFLADTTVDIVQGFAGVLIKPRFFDYGEFLHFVQNVTLDGLVWKSDDTIISGYLEYRNVTKMLVSGGTYPKINTIPSKTNNLAVMMHNNVMEAVLKIRKRLLIWQEYTLVDIESLSKDLRGLINCEAGHMHFCPTELKESYKGSSLRREVTRMIDKALLFQTNLTVPTRL